MSKQFLALWLVMAVLNRLEVNAYHQPASYHDGQSTQAGLSAATHSAYDNRLQEQPIYERESACPPAFTGLVPYPHDCHRYVNCYQGSPTIQTCAPGTLFDSGTLKCDIIGKVTCGPQLLGNSISSQPSRSARLRQVEAEPKCPPGVNGLHPHPGDCTKFLNCAHGQTFVQSCGPGTAFSPSQLICDYKGKVNCGDDAAPDNRQGKTYGNGQQMGNRWSNMNMQRPEGIGFRPQEANQGWNGQGSSYVRHNPTQSVLYVEGSLHPNRNYPSYETPLAPMPSSTSQVYYAEPVEQESDTPSWSRQDFSRRINYGSETKNDWQPRPTYSQPLAPLAPLGGQQPLDLEYNPETTTPNPYLGQQPLDLEYQPQPEPNYPNSGRQPQPQNANPGRQPHGHFPGRQPTRDLEYQPAGQQPLDLDYQPQDTNRLGQPSRDPLPGSQSTPDYPQQNRNPERQPSKSPASYPQDQLPSGSHQQPVDLEPDNDSPLPTVPSNHRPTYGSQPEANESNLYGGLLPPTKNPSTFPIYPPLANDTKPQRFNQPHYSPAYAGVAHSHNSSWQKVPPRSSSTPSTPPNVDPFNPQSELDEYEDENLLYESTTTEKHSLNPPPFNHQFYNPSLSNPNVDAKSQMAMNEALRLMLRPYFNHSGNAPEQLAKQTASAIVSVISRPPTTPDPVQSTSTTPKPGRLHSNPDDDVELISAGEQESLDDNTDKDSVVPDAWESARTEQTLNPTTHTSGDETTDFYRSTRRVDIDTTTTQNWHTSGHNRDYHRRHPNLPDPFEKPHSHHHIHHHEHSPLYHSQHPRHNEHQHSADFHRRHPGLPNPFQPEQQQPEEEEYFPNPNAEATTPKLYFRSNFDESCEFDCGNEKCVKRLEVCDGVDNCGNRLDESQCDHLGYQVRLTGGESSHMGRIEVKVNDKWGYVCDDKFGLRDADVICRELGYKMGAQEVRGNSFYAPPDRNFNYAMDKVECQGNETKLKDCEFKGWGVHNCGVDEVVGVVCKVPVLKCPNNYWLCHTSKQCIPSGFVCDHTEDCADKSDESDAVCKAPVEYRLEGGRSPSEGRLEVKYHGEWGSVCDDDFNLKSAQIACNSLGFYGQAKIEKNIFGPGNGPIWLDQVMCLGNETSIDKCSHWNWGEHNCNHTEDVGLRCTAGPAPRQQRQQRVRLQPVDQKAAEAGATAALSMSDIGLWERSSKALHSPRRCGIFKDDLIDEYAHPEERVIKGSVAQRGRHPWQATIRTRGRGGISSHWCGAVVISKRHLLTAAHCLYGHPKGAYFVRVGDHYANIAESSEVDTFIENWYTHEKFRDDSHMNNDIALVVLKTPLKFSDYVQPICLPDKDAALVENRTCTISGWGSIKSGVSTPSQILRAAQLPILPEATCKRSNVYGSAMTEGMFCAGSMDESVDACEGDSGGPLVCSDEDGETLYGIISWGQHCGFQNRPGVYVRVNYYIDWIFEKINQSLQRF